MKKAFKMKVYPDKHQEYEKRHNELWPEMKVMLKEHGALSYSIFLDQETSELFGYLEIEDEEQWLKTSSTPINQKWWDYMADIMETTETNAPLTKNLIQVFDL